MCQFEIRLDMLLGRPILKKKLQTTKFNRIKLFDYMRINNYSDLFNFYNKYHKNVGSFLNKKYFLRNNVCLFLTLL